MNAAETRQEQAAALNWDTVGPAMQAVADIQGLAGTRAAPQTWDDAL
ncbi:MAG TPA: hypothetical protein VG146_05075 [Verrucomicrobiae bacterium]|nr:hypothetical protein [Verrucomicrobiae bacterium]